MELVKELQYHWYWLMIQYSYYKAMRRLDNEPLDFKDPELRYTKRRKLNRWKEIEELKLHRRIYG